MGKSEKLVVLGVLFFVVLLFVWSLQSDGSSARQGADGVQASERDSVIAPRMNERVPRDGKGSAPKGGGAAAQPGARSPYGKASLQPSDIVDSDEARQGGTIPTRMLLAETKVSGSQASSLAGSDGAGSDAAAGVEVNAGSARRKSGPLGASTLADPAHGAGATSRNNAGNNGISRARIRMQPGWDLITTAGLLGTVDPSMFLYEVSAPDATWASLAKDLYGDATKSNLLRHNNESMQVPNGPIFVPAKDELGKDASVRTVEVLQGESLWQVAKRTLGKGSEWKAVWEANRDVIPDPDIVAAGTVLRIPIR